MLDTKLILVEGLPGSGKSTTAQFIALQLKENGLLARWFHEAEKPHPIRAQDALQRDRVEEFVAQCVNNWQSFVDKVEGSTEISVHEAMLFQSMAGLLFSRDIQRNRIMDIVLHIQEITRPLNPILIYLKHHDVAKAVRKTYDLRGKTLEQKHIQWIEKTSFAQGRQLQGFDGLVAYFQSYQGMTDDLFNRLNMKKLAIEYSSGDWDKYYRQILGFLSIKQMDPRVTKGYLNKFVGTYRGEEPQHNCVIEMEDDQLMVSISIIYKSHLIPKGENCFYAAGAPIELCFQEDGSSVICRMEHKVLWEWDLEGKVLSKVG